MSNSFGQYLYSLTHSHSFICCCLAVWLWPKKERESSSLCHVIDQPDFVPFFRLYRRHDDTNKWRRQCRCSFACKCVCVRMWMCTNGCAPVVGNSLTFLFHFTVDCCFGCVFSISFYYRRIVASSSPSFAIFGFWFLVYSAFVCVTIAHSLILNDER